MDPFDELFNAFGASLFDIVIFRPFYLHPLVLLLLLQMTSRGENWRNNLSKQKEKKIVKRKLEK